MTDQECVENIAKVFSPALMFLSDDSWGRAESILRLHIAEQTEKTEDERDEAINCACRFCDRHLNLSLEEFKALHPGCALCAAEQMAAKDKEIAFLSRQLEQCRDITGQVQCKTDEECVGCGCRMLSAVEAVAELRREKEAEGERLRVHIQAITTEYRRMRDKGINGVTCALGDAISEAAMFTERKDHGS